MNTNNLEELKKRIHNLEIELSSVKNELLSWEGKVEPQNSQESAKSIGIPISNDTTVRRNSRSWLDWEFLLAGNWMAKVGIGAVLLATLWFLDLAFTNNWITDSAKIWMGLLIGLGLAGSGALFFRSGNRILSPALIGSGFSVLYLSVFASYRFYNFIGIEETFIYLLITSVLLVILSKVGKNEALYGFGLIGCILLPILLSTGENSYRFLFAYLAMNLVLFAWVSHNQSWTWASILVFILHWTVFDVWLFSELSEKVFWIPMAFLFFTVGFFLYREHFLEKDSNQSIHPFIPGLLVAGSLAMGAISSTYMIDEHFPGSLGFSYLSMAILGSFVGSRIPGNEYQFQRIPVLLYSIYALVLLSLLVTVSDSWLGLAFVGFAFVFSYSSDWVSSKETSAFHLLLEYILWGMVILRVVFVDGLENDSFSNLFLWNGRFPILFSLVVALYYFYYQNRKEIPLATRTKFFATSAVILLIWSFLVEVHFYIEDSSLRNQGYSLVLGVFAGIFLGLGIKRKNPFYRKIGILLIGSIITKFVLHDIWFLSLVVKITAGFLMGIILIILGIYYEKIKSKLLGEIHES